MGKETDKDKDLDVVADDDIDLDDISDEDDNDESFDLDGDSDEDIVTEDGDEDEAVDGEDELDETDTDGKDGETGDESGKADENTESPATDSRDATIEDLRKQLSAKDRELSNVRSLGKETLQKMGVKVDGSVEEAFEKANAESEGISVEEYRKARAATEEARAAEAEAKRQQFEQLAASDLSTLKKSFPDLLQNKHIADCFDTFDEFVQFGKLRDSGVDPKTAYLAVNGEKVRSKQEAAAKQKATSGDKAHLKSAVTKQASGDTVMMSKETLREWRDLFPDKTDKEIKALYKQSL